jgi:4a-hydroxytetrahydrobiopterin dehydratase
MASGTALMLSTSKKCASCYRLGRPREEFDDQRTGREDLHAMPGRRAAADRRGGGSVSLQAPEWMLREEATRIERTYRFKSFGNAFAFVRGAGELAEAEFHHPDISFAWGYATVSLRTKKIKGLHENDFIMAVKLDWLAGKIAVADKQAER